MGSYVVDESNYAGLNALPESNARRLDTRILRLSLDLVEEDPIHLIERIQAGTRVEESYEKLYKKFRPGIRSLFLRKGFTSQESDDLTQDVFLRVFKGIDTFRRESRFERWLWEIAANIYFNEVRRRRTEKRDGLETSLDSGVETEEGLGPGITLLSTEPSPEEEVVRRDQSQALQTALQGLPEQMRRCCILRYGQGLKYKEIAVLMRISIETVKAHLHQARKRLTADLGEPAEPGPKRESDT